MNDLNDLKMTDDFDNNTKMFDSLNSCLIIVDLQFEFLKFLYFSNSIPAAFNTDISKSIELFIE